MTVLRTFDHEIFHTISFLNQEMYLNTDDDERGDGLDRVDKFPLPSLKLEDIYPGGVVSRFDSEESFLWWVLFPVFDMGGLQD